MALDIERRIGNEILRKIRSLQLPLELDEITEGRGNCFPLAILAQCRRPEIFKDLDESMKYLVHQNDPTGFRQQVHRFMGNSKHPKIQEYRRRYEEIISIIDNRGWNEYWKVMTRNYEWVDYIFIQSTAWFLGFDIIIVTTTSTDRNPYITISGNLSNENLACPGLPLMLGSKTQVHFQSLLPLRVTVQKNEVRAGSPEDSIKMRVSALVNSGSEHKIKVKTMGCQSDLSSLDEFPELKPIKVHKRAKLGTTTLTERKQKFPKTYGKPKESPSLKETQSSKDQNNKIQVNNSSPKQAKNPEEKTFTYKFQDKNFYFQFHTERRIKCPQCRNDFKNILNHIMKSRCKFPNIDDLLIKLEDFLKVNKEAERKEKQKEWKAKSRQKQRENDNQKVKDNQNKYKAKSRETQRENDNQKVKDNQNKHNMKSRATQRENDNQKVKDNQNKYKVKSRETQRENDNQKVKDNQNKHNMKSRATQREDDNQKVKDNQNKHKIKSRANQRDNDNQKVKNNQNRWTQLSRKKRKLEDPEGPSAYEKKRRLWNASDRLREFKEATKYNAIFICSCCHRRLFCSNVEVITDRLKSTINEKKPGHFRDCVEMEIVTPINGRNDCYICKTCISHMKAKKMPPMAVKNKLELENQDDTLLLTELEGSLIAKNIIFQKIFQLPKSRWTALTDKIVNVPITNEDINNTIELLPRTPKEAGLIGVALKRKLEYKNSHKRQLINPNKILRMLDLLKKSGNPYYQLHDDFDAYEDRCKENDPEGYKVVFSKNDEVEEDMEVMPKSSKNQVIDEIALKQHFPNLESDDDLDSDDDEDFKEEVDYVTHDPVRKYQFAYNKSVCMANKYPEIEVKDPTKDIEVAPGEGKVPNDIMQEKDWDIKAFPHLHNPDGSNGKDQRRKVNLTDQNYFIQRILNKDKRFAGSPAYTYAAVAYLEKKQLQRNINLSGTRGRQMENIDGGITYELEDGYTVLDDIKNTPRYWKKAKYEMLAKLDNIGAFQFFFTLSCADMRWQENFAAILRDQGLNLTYKVIPDEEGEYTTNIEVEFDKEGKTVRKDIQQYLEDEVQSSLHEMIRGNVLLATRYFNDRVKKFMNLIVMGDNNPMMVEYFTYKVEFQERGAGHIHGTLWLKLDMIERLIRNDNNELVLGSEDLEDLEENTGLPRNESQKPFKGISSAFKKLKNMEDLSESEKDALRNFIDEFTTVSTNEEKVGKKVSKMVLEVNIHSHTKSCRKYDCPCRFFYPRFPSVRTIIAEPIRGMDSKKKKEKLKEYEKVLSKVKDILMDSEAVEEIINSIGDSTKEPIDIYKVNKVRRIEALLRKAEVSLEDYEVALSFTNEGYKVVIERDLTEIFVNSYNAEWMEAWNGNMDMQPCFDYHATITYISDYFGKDDTGLMEVINSVAQQDAQQSTKERMKTVANTFLTHRQIGEAEAVYRLIPNMLLKNSNIACQWLSVGKRSEISKRWKLATKTELESREGLVKIKDHEGLWYQQQDMLSKFLRRSEQIELICPVQFAKMLTTSGLKSSKKDKDSEEDEDAYEIDEVEHSIHDSRQKWDFIITETDDTVPLPKLIEIKNPYPGEPRWMRKRKRPAVIRYHKSNKDKQYENWMLKELMLYTPYREEDLENYEKNTAEVYMQKESWINSVKAKVMEHLESVEEARYMVEQSTKEVDSDAIGISMDAALEQDNADCQMEGVSDHPDYLYLDTDGIDQHSNKQLKSSIFKEIEIPSISELKKQTRELDKFQKEVLNISIKYAKDIVKARRAGNNPPNPIYLMGHGGAGAGKSTVIHLISKWCHLILSKEGDDIECPHILKTAFTGTAASNIEGQTLHTSFGFTFENKHYSLSDKARDEKRTIFKNLKIIIIDEVSMVKSDMLYQLDLKLQELKERVGVPFGGVSILVFGDMLQLRPVMGSYVFERPRNQEFHATFRMDNRWEKFATINLEENHRQGEDRSYAEILNRIRVGKMTEHDISQLKKRVRSKNHADLKNADLFIVPTRKKCSKYNSKYIDSLEGEEYQLKARHYHPTQNKFKPFIDHKEGTIGTTSFQDNLRLKIGAKIIIIHNIDTSDSLTNGQLGALVSVIKSKDGEVDKLIVKLQKKNAGIQNRRKFAGLASKYPDSVIIERSSVNHSLRKRGGAVGSTATLVQFPVKLAHAITAHKIQGQTIPKPMTVAYDIDSVFEEGQGYVMLSRVQELKQVYFVDKFNPEKLYPSQKALAELERMNKVSWNKNPGPWGKPDADALKIVSLNCAGLRAHFQDIQSDDRLRQADIIHLQEISLTENEIDDEFRLDNYQASFIKSGKGKGVAEYYRDKKITSEDQINMEKFQIGKIVHKSIDIINIYRSQTGNSLELLQHLMTIIKEGRPTLITGDFNECFMENFNSRLIQGLLGLGFSQLVHEGTHIQGRHIDHAYLLDPTRKLNSVVVRYSPYYSDHDGICIVLTNLSESKIMKIKEE